MLGCFKRVNWFCIKAICLLIGGLSLCQGCLSVTFLEKEAHLAVDKNQLDVLSDLLSGETVTDSVIVRANRSWDAEIIPAVDWITLDFEEYDLLSGVTEEVPLRLTFANNDREFPRVAQLVITSGSHIETVNIVQSSLTPRLVVQAEGVENLAFDGAVCTLKVLSNVDWDVNVTDKSDIELNVETEVKAGGGNVTVTFPENYDLESTQYADLTFSAQECEDVTVKLTQAQAVPYARIMNVTGGEEILPSIGGTRYLTVKSNVDWTIAVKDNLAENVTFSVAGGSKGETSVRMTFTGNPDFDERRDFHARCQTLLPGEDDGRNEWKFTQERGSLLRCVYYWKDEDKTYYWPFEDKKYYWPFYYEGDTWPKRSLSIGTPNSSNTEEIFTTFAGYTYKLFSSHGNVFGTDGIRYGTTGLAAGDYLEFPVIEGHSLVQVNLIVAEKDAYSLLTPKIVCADNPEVSVGVPEEGVYENWVRTWTLEGEPSKAYRMVSTQDKTHAIKVIECIYR